MSMFSLKLNVPIYIKQVEMKLAIHVQRQWEIKTLRLDSGRIVGGRFIDISNNRNFDGCGGRQMTCSGVRRYVADPTGADNQVSNVKKLKTLQNDYTVHRAPLIIMYIIYLGILDRERSDGCIYFITMFVLLFLFSLSVYKISI